MSNRAFEVGEYYHIFNRGVEKREIFGDERDYWRFLGSMKGLNNGLGEAQRNYLKKRQKSDFKDGIFKRPNFDSSKSDFGYGLAFQKSDFSPLIRIIAYCLNPNHYHIILEQLVEGGITCFMRKLGTSYTKYFNIKHHRSGHLFQGKFKSSHIHSSERLVWLSAYVNGNPEIHKIAKAETWRWSSCQEYLGEKEGGLCDSEIVLQEFRNIEEYRKFVDSVIREAQESKEETAPKSDFDVLEVGLRRMR